MQSGHEQEGVGIGRDETKGVKTISSRRPISPRGVENVYPIITDRLEKAGYVDLVGGPWDVPVAIEKDRVFPEAEPLSTFIAVNIGPTRKYNSEAMLRFAIERRFPTASREVTDTIVSVVKPEFSRLVGTLGDW